MIAVRSIWLVAFSLVVASASALAAQPLVTDDAAVVAAKTCQLEAWAHLTHGDRDYSAQPACSFVSNLEFAMGATHAQHDSGNSSKVVQMQAKTVLLSRGDGAWSLGAALGLARDTGAPHGGSAFQTYYAKGLASWYPRSDLEFDFNLGGANVYGSGTFALSGVAVQYAVVRNVQLLAEAFRDEPGRGKYQVGARYIVIADRLETYVSYGNRFNGPSGQSWSIIGIRVQSPPFLN